MPPNGTGRAILETAPGRGHEVTAFARRASALAGVAGLSAVIEGDGRDPAALERAVKGQGAVISVVSGGREPEVITGIARAFADQAVADRAIAASDLDWTNLRATRLTGGAARPSRFSTELFGRGPYRRSRASYADALLDHAENGAHSRQIVNLTG